MDVNAGKDSVNSMLARYKWPVRFITRLNVVLYRISGGRLMNTSEGSPVCLVTMTGHRSGKTKTIALMYTADEERILLVASLGGQPQHPQWYYNFKAHPEIVIQSGTVQRRMLAREATAEERRSIWPKVVASFPSFADYQKKTTRELPVFICTPIE